ncbi:MAG TPA: HNH endonuclease signature motif containing protein [Acidimicrobiia bacterium]|nr:HNH endonuclease signature motif containing protein [Acidimicrobiia bacterium]
MFEWDAEEDQVNRWEEELVECERQINWLRSRQAKLIGKLDPHQIAWSSGDRNVTDWLSSTLDISHQTARRLRNIAYSNHSQIKAELDKGAIGIDRASLLVELAQTGLTETELLSLSPDYSLGRLYGMLERRRRVSAEESQTSFSDRYLVIQPSLDQSAHKIWGLAVGPDGEMIAQALHRKETELPVLEDQTNGQRRLDALAAICLDSLTGTVGEEESGERRAVTVAEVFVDGLLASQTQGEAGVTLSSGPKAGPDVLSEILCSGKVRIIASDLHCLFYSDLGEAVPPALRALVMARDMGICSIEGCRSRYRLQIHHLTPRSRGGSHHPDNLITLCWYHHHVAIHGMGMEVDPETPVHRRRLRWPRGRDPTPPVPDIRLLQENIASFSRSPA